MSTRQSMFVYWLIVELLPTWFCTGTAGKVLFNRLERTPVEFSGDMPLVTGRRGRISVGS